MEKVFNISEVARELGVSVDWLRDGEKKGKIPKARRNLNGWRVYSQGDVNKIHGLLIPSAEDKPKAIR
jgi:DNA-binding transcriptional MerR regulator